MNRRNWIKSLALGSLAVGAGALPVFADEAENRKKAAAWNKKILLYSGWAVHNIGDIGHTPGTLRYFTEFLPNAQIACWLRKSNEAVVGMLKKRFPKVEFIENAKLDNKGVSDVPALQKAFDECDVFIQNSGMHFNRYWAPPIGLLHACKAKNKPIGLYGQSFDGYRPQDVPELPKMLSTARFIFTRDTESLEFLRKNGVTAPVLEFGPDGCFGIDVRDDEKANAFMAQHKLEPRKFLAVIIRSDLREIAKPDDPDGAKKDASKMGTWFTKYSEAIIEYVRTTKMKVVIVPEVEKEIAVAKTQIIDKLPDDVKPFVIWRDTWWNCDEAVSLYAQAHSMLALEPHSVIMALAHGVPAVHYCSVNHGTKAYMFRDVGLSEWLIDVDDEPPATALRALERIRNNYDLALAKVKRAMDFVNRRSAEMAQEIATI